MASLVTGATGFIGSHVVEELLARGERVVALVRDPAKVAGLQKAGADLMTGDVCDPASLAPAVRDVDVVYHCAAAVGPGHSRQSIYAINHDGVRNTLSALRQGGYGRFVFVSSLNVLGTRDLDGAVEDLPCRRSSDPAADVKIEAERLVREAQRQGLDTTIVRPGVVYGPRDAHNLPKLASAVRRGKFSFIGSRDNVVPLVHVRDVVQALLLAGTTPRAAGRTYHVTDGARTTIGELVDHLAELQGVPRPTKVLPYLVPYAGCLFFEWLARLRLYHGKPPIARNSLRFLGTSRRVDIGRARYELGYEPRVPWRAGVAETLAQFEDSTHGRADCILTPA